MANRIDRIIPLIFATRRLMHEQRAGKGGSLLHFVTLAHIKEQTPTMKGVALFLGISSPSATSLIRNLASSGLVRRQEVQGDRRVVRIVITKKGDTFLGTRRALVEEGMRARLSQLTADEQIQLEHILMKIVTYGNDHKHVTEKV